MSSLKAPSQKPHVSEQRPAPESPGDKLTERNVQAIVKLEEAARQERSPADKFADAVARFCGSVTFLWTHVAGFGLWIGLNIWQGGPRFDPFPFTFLTLVVSLEAIFLSTFILISQNQETRLAERRNHLDLQINLLAEQENTKMLRLIDAIAESLGVKVDDDPETTELKAAIRPENLVKQIDEAAHAKGDPRKR